MNRMKKDVQLTLLSRIPVMLLSFLAVVLMTRLLGPEGNGVYTYTFAALNLLITLTGFQLEGTLPVFLAKEKDNTAAVLSAAGILSVLSFLLFTGLLTFIVFILPGGSHWVIAPDQPVGFFFVFILIAFGLRRISALMQASLRGMFQFKSFNAYILIQQGLPVLVYGLLCWNMTIGYVSLSLIQYFQIMLMVETLIVLAGVYLIYHHRLLSFSSRYKEYLKPMSTMSFQSVISAFGHFLNKRLDVWFVQFYKGTAMLGQYGLATQVTNFISEAMTPFNQVLIPYISEAPASEHKEIVARTARLNMLIACSAALLIICTSWFFIPAFFGKAFAPAIPASQVLSVGIIFISQRLVFTGYFKAINQMQYPIRAAWSGVVITVLLDLALIPVFGITGAAWATIIAYGTTSVYLIFCAQQKLNFQLHSILVVTKSDLQWLLSRKKRDPKA